MVRRHQVAFLYLVFLVAVESKLLFDDDGQEHLASVSDTDANKVKAESKNATHKKQMPPQHAPDRNYGGESRLLAPNIFPGLGLIDNEPATHLRGQSASLVESEAAHLGALAPDLKLSVEELGRCSMVTSSVTVTPEKVVFATPSLLVIQEVKESKGNMHRLQRSMAFRHEDGSCREESSMELECEGNTNQVDHHCKEYRTAVGKGSCFAASPGVCSFLGPAKWTQPTIAAGVLAMGSSTGMKARDGHLERNILMVGLAAGSIPGYLSQHLPNVKITAVDVDPDVVFAAHHFFLQGGLEDRPQGRQVNLVLGDGMAIIEKQQNKSLAAIFMDAYSPSDEPPTGLYGEAGLSVAKQKLQDGGRIIMTVNIDPTVSAGDVMDSLKKLGFSYVAKSNSPFSNLVMGIVGKSRGAPSLVGNVPDEVVKELTAWHGMSQWSESK